ncbi:MAG: right-handed parallel beta-helix repeat-containing protein, partial [Methanobacteriota archaeon]
MRPIIIATMMIISVLVSVVLLPDSAIAYTPHAPIRIDGDIQFTPANGVTSGSGAPGDPYIIQGWSINASAAHAIEIRNTTAHFKISSVYVYSDVIPSFGNGIVLYNATNGNVELCVFEDYLSYAIYADKCTDCSFSNNTFQRRVAGIAMPQTGVYLYECDRTSISYNNFTWTGSAVLTYFAPNTTVTYNNITNGGNGIQFSSYSNNSIVDHNTLSSVTSYAIATWSVDNITVVDNDLRGCNHVSIGAYGGSSNLTIRENNISDGVYAIYTQNARDLRVSSNDVVNCTQFGICIDRTMNVTVSSNQVFNNGITLFGQTSDHYDTHTIGTDNEVNGKPTMYIKGSQGEEIEGGTIGQLIVVASSNVSVSNLDLGNTDAALQIAYSAGILFEDIVLSPTTNYGALLYKVDDLTLRRCNLSHSTIGISGNFIDNATIAYNEISYNSMRGIGISSVTNSRFMCNRITNNTWEGIYYQGFWTDVSTEIAFNEFSNNQRGIYLSDCPGVICHHNNFLGNTVQAMDNLGASNLWNGTYPSGGNFWSDYVGVDLFSGPNQDIAGGDGIGDSPYAVDGD